MRTGLPGVHCAGVLGVARQMMVIDSPYFGVSMPMRRAASFVSFILCCFSAIALAQTGRTAAPFDKWIYCEPDDVARRDAVGILNLVIEPQQIPAGIDSERIADYLRVEEVGRDRWSPLKPVVFQYHPQTPLPPNGRIQGELLVFMPGITAAGASRSLRVRLASTPNKSNHPPLVELEDIGEYEGEATWKITTPTATYFYHQWSGGFASMVDPDGNDWIRYHPGDKERGEYRGIPNIAPPQFHPGRPEGKKPGRIASKGPLRIRLLAETEDGAWATQWDIYPTYAQMTLLRRGPEPYWILYEGTPGGEFTTSDYWVDSRGKRFDSGAFTQKNMWHGDLPAPEWVYFGDAALRRVLFLAREPYSPVIDEYWHFGDGGMTVFGFARGPRAEGWQRLTDPSTLTIGFVEHDEHSRVAAAVTAAQEPMTLRIRDWDPDAVWLKEQQNGR